MWLFNSVEKVWSIQYMRLEQKGISMEEFTNKPHIIAYKNELLDIKI